MVLRLGEKQRSVRSVHSGSAFQQAPQRALSPGSRPRSFTLASVGHGQHHEHLARKAVTGCPRPLATWASLTVFKAPPGTFQARLHKSPRRCRGNEGRLPSPGRTALSSTLTARASPARAGQLTGRMAGQAMSSMWGSWRRNIPL